MNISPANAFTFLISTLLDLYITAVLLRLLLQWVRADFYNPLSQFLVKLTNPAIIPLRRGIPSIGRLDTASLVLMITLEIFSVWLAIQLSSKVMAWAQIVPFAIIKLCMTLLTTYFFLIIASVILSWVGQGLRHPFVPLLYQLTEPVLRPIRRVIPPIAGIDLSALFALIAIRFMIHLLGW